MDKLFISDLDGTLLNENHRVSKLSKKALKMLGGAGYDIALCSGRVLKSVEAIGKEAGLDQVFSIGNNGAVISYEGEILFSCPIEGPKVRQIIDILEERSYGYHMYDEKTFYSNKYESEYLEHLTSETGGKRHVKTYFDENIVDYIEANRIPIYKIMLHLPFKEDMETYKKIKNLGGLYLSMSGNKAADIMNYEVSKGKAIERLEKLSGKKYSKLVAIGDHENDIPMLKHADYKISMGNSIDELKAISDYVTSTNKEEGFYRAVCHVLEEKKNRKKG